MDKLLSGRRILVVEDEMLIVMMIESMLADLGCESITAAGTVDQAVALIEGQVFDAATLDVNLHGTNSRPVADALAARGVPFFFSTGNAAHHTMDGYGDRAILRKPFIYEDLVAIFTGLLFADQVAILYEPAALQLPAFNAPHNTTNLPGTGFPLP
jgi:CheY-like chemotaxis protein